MFENLRIIEDSIINSTLDKKLIENDKVKEQPQINVCGLLCRICTYKEVETFRRKRTNDYPL